MATAELASFSTPLLQGLARSLPCRGVVAILRSKATVGILGLVGLGIAAVTTLPAGRSTLPAPAPLAAAVALLLVALGSVAQAWIALFPQGSDRRALARSIYVSQLSRYLPAGGFFQAAGQVALSSEGDVGAAVIRLPVFAGCGVAAGATVGAALATQPHLPAWGRLLAGSGLALLVLLHRGLLGTMLSAARRALPRLPEPARLPSQRAILCCFAAQMVNLVAYAAAFVLLLGGHAGADPLAVGVASCAAWTVGYLALPLPSGIGLREAVLVAALPGVAVGALLAASLAHRLAALLADVVMATASQRLRRSRAGAGT